MSEEINNEKDESAEKQHIERMNDAIGRCYGIIDYISNLAENIATDVIYNNTCTEVRHVLLNSPEELAVKSFQKAIDDYKLFCNRNKSVN